MVAGHTPGPWAWRWKSGSLHRVTHGPSAVYGDTVLASCFSYATGTETQVGSADAALIAAAPDLLEALKSTTAALAAALHLLECGGRQAAASDRMFQQMLVDYKAAIKTAQAAFARATDR